MKRRPVTLILILFAAMAIAAPSHAAAKKILIIDSYHEGYFWSDSIIKGAMAAFEGKDAVIDVVHMDTKRNTSEDFKIEAGRKVKAHIDAGGYDAVIAMDDNASKYVVAPYYKDADLPFVFCGVNWDASIYGYPYQNATGMVEISPIQLALKHLKPFVKGDKLAFLGADTTTGQKNLENFKNILKLAFVNEKLVSRFDDWKQAFTEVQDQADMLVLSAPGGISDWDFVAAEQFILANASIPIGTDEPEFKNLTLLGFTKIPQEHGEYAATVVLKILDGAPVSDFPVVNSRQGDLVLNMKLAKKLGVQFPFSLVKMAKPENVIK